MKLGVYKTRCGLNAIAAKVRAQGMFFVVKGAIEDYSHVLYLHEWTIDGASHTHSDFDLVTES